MRMKGSLVIGRHDKLEDKLIFDTIIHHKEGVKGCRQHTKGYKGFPLGR